MSDDPFGFPDASQIESLPWPLNKALNDQFTYLIVLRNGMVITCDKLEHPTGGDPPVWIDLVNAEIIYPEIKTELPLNFERGMTIRIGDIIAAVDAPHGS